MPLEHLRGPGHLVLVASLARRYYLDGRSKVEIADEFHLSRFKVARLQGAYRLRHAVVVDTVEKQPAVLRRRVGRAAADLMTEIVTADDVLGLGCSRAVAQMAAALRRLAPCKVVQLSGAAFRPDNDAGSVDIVRDVARVARGHAYCFYAPLIVPDATTARVLLRRPEVARAVSMFAAVTKAVVAIGSWNPPGSIVQDAISPGERRALGRLGVQADVSGVLLDADGLPVSAELASRMICIDAASISSTPWWWTVILPRPCCRPPDAPAVARLRLPPPRTARGLAGMRGVFLPGRRVVEIRELPDPAPGAGQVLLAMRASTICGSDLRAIYRDHLGSGPEAYQDVVAGHEPAGDVVAVGAGVRRIRVGDRVVVYHISGCGQCDDCRRGYQISCSSPRRAAYGWQRDGGHADLLLAEERDLLALPEPLTYLDGACVACGFATAYEALCRLWIDSRDRLLVTGLGPVGLAAGLLGRAMGATAVVGTDPSAQRRAAAVRLGAVDHALDASAAHTEQELADLLPGGGAEASIDCSGNGAAQATALRHTRRWGRVALVGEGGHLSVDVSETIIHKQLTIHGSWVASTWRSAELLDCLVRWELHPSVVVSDTFSLQDAEQAYAHADAGASGGEGQGAVGKVGIVWPG